MKPRTKIEKAVDMLQDQLSPSTQRQEDYAFEKCFEKFCYKNKTSAFCLECGGNISIDLIGRKRTIKCPNCDAKLKVKNTLKRSLNSPYEYFAVAEIVEHDKYSFQVVRVFELAKYQKKGKKHIRYFSETCQNWYESNSGKRVVYSKLDNMYGYQGDLEIRHPGYYKNYNPMPNIYCPTSMFKKEYAKYGVSSKMTFLTLQTAYSKAKSNSQSETLLKAGYYEVLRHCESSTILAYWSAFKLCIRYKYKIQSISIYVDYLRFLNELNKDLKNPTVVCPKDLMKAHDEVMNIVNRRREKIRAAQERINAEKKALKDKERIERFYAEKSKFFDIKISSKDIIIEPLKSIDDFIEESKTHKHCVFSGKYYGKKDSLVMRAMVNNKSVETIEVSLKEMEIIQSRGLQNRPSEHHNEIIDLVKKNIHVIKKIHQLQPSN